MKGSKGPAVILRPLRYAIIPVVIAAMTIGIFSSYLADFQDLVRGDSLLQTAFEVGQLKHVGLSNDFSAGGSSLAVGITDASARGILICLQECLPSYFAPIFLKPTIRWH